MAFGFVRAEIPPLVTRRYLLGQFDTGNQERRIGFVRSFLRSNSTVEAKPSPSEIGFARTEIGLRDMLRRSAFRGSVELNRRAHSGSPTGCCSENAPRRHSPIRTIMTPWRHKKWGAFRLASRPGPVGAPLVGARFVSRRPLTLGDRAPTRGTPTANHRPEFSEQSIHSLAPRARNRTRPNVLPDFHEAGCPGSAMRVRQSPFSRHVKDPTGTIIHHKYGSRRPTANTSSTPPPGRFFVSWRLDRQDEIYRRSGTTRRPVHRPILSDRTSGRPVPHRLAWPRPQERPWRVRSEAVMKGGPDDVGARGWDVPLRRRPAARVESLSMSGQGG
ncbi:hypothetical protein BSF38_04854 [Paludisphaera borealis]|uniref:Uncharacterized protein n=1 Tax=Paludisphaera borealis TaxID=1387353 RepID=A0A1U7CWG0_9BACT|nr:hypothetical protein BSF38_04854 [Paludisphaera borealis]